MMKRTLAALCVAGLAACAAPGGGGAAAASVAGTRWVGEIDARIPPGEAPRLEFVSGGRLTGYTGCNMLSGTWRQDGAEIRFGAIVTTKRGCLGPGGELEKQLLAALNDRASARREGARLVITGPGGARFAFSPA